jgi:hypothetical protein
MAEIRFLLPRGFFQIQIRNDLKQPLAPPQCKITVAYSTLNHSIAIASGRWMTIPFSPEMVGYVTFGLIMQLKMRHIFVLECPLYNPIRDEFPSLFEDVVLGSLKLPLNWIIKLTLAFATLKT